MRFQHTIRKGIDLLDVYGASTGICADIYRPLRESMLRRTEDFLVRLIYERQLQIVLAQNSDPRFSRLFTMNALELLLV